MVYIYIYIYIILMDDIYILYYIRISRTSLLGLQELKQALVAVFAAVERIQSLEFRSNSDVRLHFYPIS